MLQFAATKNFQAREVAAYLLRLAQHLLIDHRSRFEFAQPVEIDHGVTFLKGRVIKTAFRQAANQGHLATFKAETQTSAGTRLLSFVTFPAGFSVTRTLSAAKSFHPMSRAGTGFEI